jgi:anti-sigma B factor antagonist
MGEIGIDPIFGVDTWSHGGRLVVMLVGDLDVHTAARLRAALEGWPADARRRVAVELSRLDFLDSSGLGVLVGAMKHAKSQGGGLCVVAPQERILKTLCLTGLIRVMPAFAGLRQAFVWLDAQRGQCQTTAK